MKFKNLGESGVKALLTIIKNAEKAIQTNKNNIDKEIAETKADLNELEQELIITDTATGERITVDNSADASVREFKVDGRTEQATTTGKNLLNPLTTEATVNGVTFTANTDGSMSFSGTATANAEKRITNDVPLPVGNYIMSSQRYDTQKYLYQIKITRNGGNAVWLDFSKGDCNFTINDGDKINYTSVVVKAGATVNETIYPMIRKAEITDGTYEPYTNGASPNPDYKQDIKGVGESGEVEVTVTGKNLLNTSLFEDNKYQNPGSGATTHADYWITGKQKILPNTTYTRSTGSYGTFFDTEGNVIKTPYLTNESTFTTPNNAYFVSFCVAKKSQLAFGGEIQLEEGNKSTEYEPYKSQTVKIPVEHMMDPSPLYKGDYARLKDKNVEIVKNNKMVVFDGSDDEGWAYNNQYFYSSVITKAIANIYGEFYCDCFMPVDINTSILTRDNSIGLRDAFVAINCSKFANISDFKAWLSQNPITVVYQLVEPTTETSYVDIDLSTYNHVTNITNSDNANMEVEYFVNNRHVDMVMELKEKIETAKTDLTKKINSKAEKTHSHSKADVGLGNVDNTSDMNKPVSTAQQQAINGAKQELDNAKAPKESPVFTESVSLGRRSGSTVGRNSATFGSMVTASGENSFATGYNTYADGNNSFVQGFSSMASGSCSYAAGTSLNALAHQYAIGHYNDTNIATANNNEGPSPGTAFVIGNGDLMEPSNAFRITGQGEVYGKAAYNATGADYAEFAEWADGNPDNEDRRGYFVTYDEEKPNMIRKANAGDYILGIVSGNPCIIGNSDEAWRGKYVFDEFGSIVYESMEVERESIDPETGETTTINKTITTYKKNPDYDPEKKYIHRKDRPEWAAVGWIGVLSVRDDGTCVPGKYCAVSDGGIATAAERGFDTYRVLERVTDNIVKVAMK